MPLYGHELHTGVDSISAGLGWCVDLNKEFIGVEELRKIEQQGPTRKLVGLELSGKRIVRQHAKVLAGEQEIGAVTSGTLSPTLGKSIAMAYVRPEYAEVGQTLTVEISGKASDATVVKLPFYKSK
jgi:aminomethyltransferase